MRFLYLLFFGISAFAARAQEIKLNWQPVAPGIWKTQIGDPDKIDLLSAAGIDPKFEALKNLGAAPFPKQLSESVGELADGKTYLRFPLNPIEQLYGLGLNFKNVQQRGTIKTLHVDHYGGRDNGRTHAPVPFYVSDSGYGVLINSARYITVYAGTGVRKDSRDFPQEQDRNTDKSWSSQPYSDAVEILVPTRGTEIFVFAGSSAMEVVQRYNLFSGGGQLPPKWGLGFTQRTPTLYSDRDVIKEADEFIERGYPLSFIGLEPGWLSRSYPNTFAWDSTRFPAPGRLIGDLLKKNIRANLWMNPYVSSYSPIYQDILPYTGTHTVWLGRIPDFTMKPVRDIYQDFFTKEHLALGVAGYKIDEVDGYDTWLWPDVAKFPSGISAEQMRQIYGVTFQKMTADWFKAKNTRTYGLVRASNAGAAALPYVIYNDYYDHRDFITALCASSFTGTLWTPEARSSKSSEEWLRRMQSVCFSTKAMLNAWSDGTKPWTFENVAPQVKQVMELRMQLLPYLYTTFAQYHFEGKPPVRAMPLVEGFSFNGEMKPGELNSVTNPYATAIRQDCKDQFMLGDFLLVAPMFAGEKSRKVILPAGKWFDFYSGKLAGDSEVIEITPGLDRIPLFVKNGGIIPLMAPRLQTPLKDEVVPLVIRHYGHHPASWRLYDDDGETFDYERGEFGWSKLSVKAGGKGSLTGQIEEGSVFKYHPVEWVFMTP